MNHLAHIVLAGTDEGLRLGAFLGDHVKGQSALADWPDAWAAGIRLHRRIDVLSDAHPAVIALRKRLDPPWRRYGGVILDVLFDHMLSRHWADFGPQRLDRLADAIDALLARHRHCLPPRLALFSRWAAAQRLWLRYGERAMLEEIFQRMAQRHGHPWPLAEGRRLLDELDGEIESAFLGLFPDLLAETADWRDAAQSS
ncbi:MAG: DUF479 domain-containing protein [Pseudomonadota bacterium]|nr:MAG: DUF479 domain-containing protein [Pseudomonadota bacterium]